MSGVRWTVGTLEDPDEDMLIWPTDPPIYVQIANEADDTGTGNADSHAAYAALIASVSDAARLRSLAARMDSHLNRGRSFTGAEVAAMLRDGGPADDSDIMPGSEFDGPVIL